MNFDIIVPETIAGGMKMKLSRRIISIILSLVLMTLPLLTAFAADGAERIEADCPYVFIHGFMGSSIYVDPSDPDSDLAWPPSGDAIWTAVKKALPALGALLITHNYDKFADTVIPAVDEMFKPIMLGPDGKVPDKSGVRWSYPEADSIKKDSRLEYVYDWRISPLEAAAGLNDFIDYVLECSGSEQIVAEAHSYGGVVLTTYAKLYGTSKIRSWMFNTTAVFGEAYTGDLFTGNLVFRDKALTAYLKGVLGYSDSEWFLDFLFDFLYYTKITALACRLVNKMSDGIGSVRLAQAILPLFGGWLSIWSMVPDEKAEQAYDYVFNTVYKDDTTDRSGLQEKVRAYDGQIRPYKAETLNQINEDANLYVISRCGFNAMFMTDSWVNESDTVIDTKYSSFGATCAPHGEKLGDDYLAGADVKYFSPGKNIDASTCMFPEQTWFLRHYTHSKWDASLDEFTAKLLYTPGQATVNTYSEYPQFLYYNEKTALFEIDTNQK